MAKMTDEIFIFTVPVEPYKVGDYSHPGALVRGRKGRMDWYFVDDSAGPASSLSFPAFDGDIIMLFQRGRYHKVDRKSWYEVRGTDLLPISEPPEWVKAREHLG